MRRLGRNAWPRRSRPFPSRGGTPGPCEDRGLRWSRVGRGRGQPRSRKGILDAVGSVGPGGLQTRGQGILGYLNFSSGASDPRFLRNMNELCAAIGPACSRNPWSGPWPDCSAADWRGSAVTARPSAMPSRLRRWLGWYSTWSCPAIAASIAICSAHQSDAALWQPFFLGRVCEAVLRAGPPWEPSSRILEAALMRLNDFIGHRPVAVLRTAQKIQPYAHEWVRPIPLYIREAGVAVGRYHEVVSPGPGGARNDRRRLARRRLVRPPAGSTSSPSNPRAYDFDHPVNRRPNYHFGGWDPHAIDNAGFYRRFVFQQVTLDGLIEPRRAERRTRAGGAAIGGRGRAGGDDPDGFGGFGERAGSARLLDDAEHADPADCRLPRRVLRAAHRARGGAHGDRLARRGEEPASALRRGPAAPQPDPCRGAGRSNCSTFTWRGSTRAWASPRRR